MTAVALKNELLDHVLGDQAYSAPANLYVGLSTTTPDIDGSSFTEPSMLAGYSRVALANNKTTWGVSANSVLKNNIDVVFNRAVNKWGWITYCGIFDDVGNMLCYDTVAAVDIDVYDMLRFPSGDLQIMFGGGSTYRPLACYIIGDSSLSADMHTVRKVDGFINAVAELSGDISTGQIANITGVIDAESTCSGNLRIPSAYSDYDLLVYGIPGGII